MNFTETQSAPPPEATTPMAAYPLPYASPAEPKPRGMSAGGAMVMITFLIGLASVIIFIIVCDAMRYNGQRNDAWPAAAAVTALAAMGAGLGFFLTRSR